MKLIAFDMGGVIFKHHNFWMELHRELGTLEEVEKECTTIIRSNDLSDILEHI